MIARTAAEIQATIESELAQQDVYIGPGSVAGLLTRLFSEELEKVYQAAVQLEQDLFLSTASGEALDRLGLDRWNLSRLPGESDDNYRYRLTLARRGVEQATEAAIWLAAVSVPGVRDAVLRAFVAGPGTGAVYPLGDTPLLSEEILAQVREAVGKAAAFGSRILVANPEPIPITWKIRAYLKPGTVDPVAVRLQIAGQIRSRFQRLLPGEPFLPARMLDDTKTISSEILQLETLRLTVVGVEEKESIFQCHPLERFVILASSDLEVV